MNADEQNKALGTHRTCGVEGSTESAKWFWNNHFSAVAGDAIAFETIPPMIDGKEGDVTGLPGRLVFLKIDAYAAEERNAVLWTELLVRAPCSLQPFVLA